MNAETSYSITDAGMSPASTDGGLRFKQAPDVSALKSLPEDCEISGYKKILSIELLKGSIFLLLVPNLPGDKNRIVQTESAHVKCNLF